MLIFISDESWFKETNLPKVTPREQAVEPGFVLSLYLTQKVPATLILYRFADGRLAIPVAISWLKIFLLACCTSSRTGPPCLRLYPPSSTAHSVTRVMFLRDTNLFSHPCIMAQNIGKMPKSLETHKCFHSVLLTCPPNVIIPTHNELTCYCPNTSTPWGMLRTGLECFSSFIHMAKKISSALKYNLSLPSKKRHPHSYQADSPECISSFLPAKILLFKL